MFIGAQDLSQGWLGVKADLFFGKNDSDEISSIVSWPVKQNGLVRLSLC